MIGYKSFNFKPSLSKLINLRLYSINQYSTNQKVLNYNEDLVINLIKAKQLFPQNIQLNNKINVLISRLKLPKLNKIRIGLIGSKPSLLNSLLIDPFESDLNWYHNHLIKRSSNENNVIKYSSKFVDNSDSNIFAIPSPFLLDKNIEFLEINNNETIELNDNVSFYLTFNKTFQNLIQINYPNYLFKDENFPQNQYLNFNEINSNLYDELINSLQKSSENSIIYSKLYPYTNIKQFIENLNNFIEISDLRLSESILLNLNLELNNNQSINQLNLKDIKIKSNLLNYSENLNHQFQQKFKSELSKFDRDYLNLWNLYEINQSFKNFLFNDCKFLQNSIKQYSYIKGQIDDLDSQSSQLNDNQLIQLSEEIVEKDLIELEKFGSNLILKNFLQLQLPIVIISSLGYFIFNYSSYSMIGLGLFGILLGLNNILQKWIKFVQIWLNDKILENFRIGILKNVNSLRELWDLKYNKEKHYIDERIKIIKTLQTFIEK
ncbi:hypothetical protein WICMUC_005326 [Wickerhamomyces mucosus]|uniref:Mmc1 C-terminal domain-containing protein n=1 Tax=Wickerhamomyces mucosus TaxID=1378264 RepID=A0A9P8P9S7_9ASCO|nr:hypothetical protein WICMUC_005326 [Wickerhamomyces mucosus]